MDRFYLIDVFVGDGAKGNPCAVMFVDDISDTERLKEIAITLNQPATTFLLKQDDHNAQVRWFAPEAEIDLCGHGSVAAIWLMCEQNPELEQVSLHYKGGRIDGESNDGLVTIAGDAINSETQAIPSHVQNGFGAEVLSYHHNWNKPIVVLKDAQAVKNLRCDWPVLESSETFAYVVTAEDQKGEYDFVSRVILPHLAKREDQATGSAQMVLTPYWSEQLGRSKLRTFQVSERGGRMDLQLDKGRVRITTRCQYKGVGELV